MEAPVSTIDLPPTLRDAAGIEVPDRLQGRSFLPLVADPGAPWPQESFIQISEAECGRSIRTSRWKYHVTAPDTDPWDDPAASRYVESALYDLDHDPYERDHLNGLASNRELADGLRERLLARMEEAGEPPARIDPAAEWTHPQRLVDPPVHGFDLADARFGHQPPASGARPR
ncbi:sulfatase/phosphatase domain-containing protein [Actinacidiphila yanglinensis]|uniref:sulfatase/phosphatase domain-containing protein n=1 Tax=Actinacidiphila yanglinensis TaxID=310779 RepID=UPI002AFE44F5|nr:sulfatase/phosphatase domain-containing protein [Actinacidiphila yanglinensis]